MCQTNRDLLQSHSSLQVPTRIQQQHLQQQQQIDELRTKVANATSHFVSFDENEASIRRFIETVEGSLTTLLSVDNVGDISKQSQKSDNLKVRKYLFDSYVWNFKTRVKQSFENQLTDPLQKNCQNIFIAKLFCRKIMTSKDLIFVN